ncbi:hypothetical protein NQZ79_g7503 [Umbelopsis isabellina]|nr:hypothetical protein NQZ79_g7503 [Umbelopsis isabellina]
MTDSAWIGELVKLGGSAVTAMIPKIRRRALSVLAITKHSYNWPTCLQVRDYEMVAMAVAVVCDKNACSGLLECADFSDVHVTGSDTETGICLTLIQEQPEALRRVATLCVYANMLGCDYISTILLSRVLSVTNEVREKLYIACETPTRAWLVEEGLSQWALTLNTDIQSWMYVHELPISNSQIDNDEEEGIKLALYNAYDGKWDALRTMIEERTNKMPKGITGLQFNIKNTGIPLWQERGLEQMIKDKNLAIRINADAQLWSMKVDTTNGFVGELQVPLSKKKLMQRYGCRFKMGIHTCLKACRYKEYIDALLVCATVYKLVNILPNWLPAECIVGFVYSYSILLEGTVADGLYVKHSFRDMCKIMHTIGVDCIGWDYSLRQPEVSMVGNQLVVGYWAANMDIGNWGTWFTRHEVGYAEIHTHKPKEAITWMNNNQLLGPENADIYTESTPAGWWCVPWVIAGVPGLRVRKGITDVLHVALYTPKFEELEKLHKTIFSNRDVAQKEVKSLLGFIREDKTCARQIIAVDGNPSWRALVYHLARSEGVMNESISLSCDKESMDNDKYLMFIDNPT